jgi:hypothetical protein
MNKGKWTYTKAVLEGDATDGQGREELGDLLAIGLGVSRRTGRRVLGRSEVGDALGRGNVDISDSHFVVVLIVDGIDCRYENLMCRDLYLYTFPKQARKSIERTNSTNSSTSSGLIYNLAE